MKEILTAEEVAEMLLCDIVTAADRLNRGVIPGLKFGRSWVIPAAAFYQRLNEMALEEAAQRRAESTPRLPPAQQPKKRGRPRFGG